MQSSGMDSHANILSNTFDQKYPSLPVIISHYVKVDPICDIPEKNYIFVTYVTFWMSTTSQILGAFL